MERAIPSCDRGAIVVPGPGAAVAELRAAAGVLRSLLGPQGSLELVWLTGTGAEAGEEFSKWLPRCDEVWKVILPFSVAQNVEAASSALARVARERGYGWLALLRGARAWDLAPLTAVLWDAVLVQNCLGVVERRGGRYFLVPMFQGKLIAEVEVVGDRPVVLTVEPAAMALPSEEPLEDRNLGRAVKAVSAESLSFDWPIVPEFRRWERRPPALGLTQAAVVVGVGRGVVAEETFERVRRLASHFGAELAGTRPVVDRGWLAWNRQVGTSGQSIRPRIYLALGVSGAFQHVVGIQGAQTVIAVNRDPYAPIFRVADVGVVATVEEFLTALGY